MTRAAPRTTSPPTCSPTSPQCGFSLPEAAVSIETQEIRKTQPAKFLEQRDRESLRDRAGSVAMYCFLFFDGDRPRMWDYFNNGGLTEFSPAAPQTIGVAMRLGYIAGYRSRVPVRTDRAAGDPGRGPLHGSLPGKIML